VTGEFEQKEATRKHEQEVKAAEEAAHAAAEAAAKRKAEEGAAIASVKILRITSTAGNVLVTIKVTGADTVTVSGAGVKQAVAHISAGTHTIKLRLTASGLAARKHHRKIKLAISVKVGTFVVALSRQLTL
jgi:membrane protein involved in colicin uptake